MIKYVLILLWFDVGQITAEIPGGQAWINYFETQELCFDAMSKVPQPTNPKIEWYSVICAEFTFINTRAMATHGIPGAWF